MSAETAERFEITHDPDVGMIHRPHPSGYYVRYSDHAALEAEHSRLKTLIAKYEARLEIDHYFKIDKTVKEGLRRVEATPEERATFPDAVEARDATISLLEDAIKRLQAENERMREALEEAREFIDGQIDVVDGSYGIPEPNRAMLLSLEIDDALSRAALAQAEGRSDG